MHDLLNPQQRQAVNHTQGPLLVLAGAGSGKTRVITHHIVHLLETGVLPQNILGVTFTNKAAAEMKSRVHQATSQNVLISTFHSLGARILRQSINHLGYGSHFLIYDEEDSLKVLKRILKSLNISEKELTPKTIRHAISRLKNELQDPSEIENDGSLLSKILPDAYKQYQAQLREANAVDFDDLLYLPVQLFLQHKDVLAHYQNQWHHLLIDEYQDINKAQYTLAHLLIEKTQNIFVVGDPDQSIYAWRGACITNILNFKKDWPNAVLVKLEQNYRSTSNILNAANALVQHNQSRYEKNLWSDLGEGNPIFFYNAKNDHAEAEHVIEKIVDYHKKEDLSFNETAILYRTNAQSRAFEDFLLKKQIPYVVIGGISFYQRKEIKDVLAWLRMVQSGSDIISFQRTMNLPKRGIGDTTLQKLVEGAYLEGKNLIDFCKDLIASPSPIVKLSKKQLLSLDGYLQILSQLRQKIHSIPLSEFIKETIVLTDYLNVLRSDPETFEDRKDNLDELVGKATEWEEETENPTLAAFLEELTLKTSLDEASTGQAKVSLMTAHNCKGLEFDLVFLVGMEEMLFPHINSLNAPQDVEEERRLCYVAMTRAKKFLHISYAKSRFLWGSLRTMRKSRFLDEIPEKFIKFANSSSFASSNLQLEQNPSHESTYQSSYQLGDVIFHNEFGVGQIKNVGSCSLGTTYDIFFQKDQSRKTLVAKFANLSKLK